MFANHVSNYTFLDGPGEADVSDIKGNPFNLSFRFTKASGALVCATYYRYFKDVKHISFAFI